MSISKERLEEMAAEDIGSDVTFESSVMARELLASRAELERLRAQEPVALTREDELSDLVKIGFSYIFPTGTEGVIHKPVKLYAEPKPLAVPDVKPSLQAMMQALDAFYAEEEVPENGMSVAYRILLNDCRAAMLQSSPVVKLPPEFCSGEGVVVQLEKVMSALAVHGIKFERRPGNAGNIDIDSNSPESPDAWIPCSERMPDKGERVLVCIDFDSTTVTPLRKDAEYTGSTFRVGPNTINTTGEPPRVTHWMKLPDFPEVSACPANDD